MTTPIFTAEHLPQTLQDKLIATGIWKPKCPVPLTRLRLLTLSYVDFDGIHHRDGKMVVLDAVADHVLAIFQELYSRLFPINAINGMEAYDGDDAQSMANNNSSAFNFRDITGGGTLPSIHSYGLAIDVNPIQNPYISPDSTDSGMAKILPPQGQAFLNRTNQRAGMVEPIVDIFINHGFAIWGGTWNNPIDWQHFQPTRAIALLLVTMEATDAAEFFTLYARFPTMLNMLEPNNDAPEWIMLYQKNPCNFIDLLKQHIAVLNNMEATEALVFLTQKQADQQFS